MNSLEKEFIPYEQALELKELGFDYPCFGWYQSTRLKKEYDLLGNQSYMRKEDCNAPTFSQAFKWFIEKDFRFNICNNCTQVDGDYYYEVWRNGSFMYDSHYIYKTYENAELACLNKLIEIVKQ